jgi:DNA binding domain protein, excisionase family
MVMNDEIDRIFILYKDRLTRFGFNYLEQICNKFGTKIIVISEEIQEKSIQEELAEDIISIIHSFSSKLYGMRNKIKEKIDKELSD